ncbi:hypothetical protein BCON_0030g00230 [Botryotinia convoluta]|uniref:Uncharacterized protein n=1 Tax=Botryotinia convoluta TaxID=54673 RepID=A0A4Z1II48_9HELO|nr:hypothetical protein BCON_0030g00230 [Botryotinia convoluta]
MIVTPRNLVGATVRLATQVLQPVNTSPKSLADVVPLSVSKPSRGKCPNEIQIPGHQEPSNRRQGFAKKKETPKDL